MTRAYSKVPADISAAEKQKILAARHAAASRAYRKRQAAKKKAEAPRFVPLEAFLELQKRLEAHEATILDLVARVSVLENPGSKGNCKVWGSTSPVK